ncbi:hypothetical protein [Micromonospora sp. RP3T]|uniref:hypothetical protein n=1 Tax=Micromonospora sp. RP3T TaxID=2135446 RepID=UPI003D72D2F6
MNTMTAVDVATGAVVDTIGVTAGATRVTYVTGEAAGMVEAVLEAYTDRGLVPVAPVDMLDGFTDGRVALRAAPVVLEAGWVPPVPNVLFDLLEAGSDRKLRAYWTHGEGAAKIRWGTGGDFKRCVRHLRKYVADPEGLCNTYHQGALGAPPGKGH